MKPTKDQQNFIDLILKLTDSSFNENEKGLNDILLMQKNNRDIINKEIGDILLKYNIKDSILNLSPQEYNKLYKELSDKINTMYNEEVKAETEQVKGILTTTGAEKYNINDYVYSMGVNYNLTPVTAKALNTIINTKIDGELWSKRIWNNKNQVAKTLKLEVKDFLTGKTNVNDVNKVIKNRFNVNATNSSRLVRTEIARVQGEANEYWCKYHNIKQQLFMATLDSRTSQICQVKDGQAYDMNDLSKPIPPLHPNCRSCLVSLVNKDWKPNQRLDNETKENIDYTTYKEWEKDNIIKPESDNIKSEDDIIKDKTLDNLTSNLKKLDINNYTDRSKLGRDILNKLDLKDIPVSVESMKERGYCLFDFGNTNNVLKYALQNTDSRSKVYQIKTSFHEAFHAKASGRKMDYTSIKKEWLQVEETFAESSSHYIMKELGFKEEIAPAYSDKLVEMLPRLKKLDKFKDCSSISDFGKIAWEDRLKGVNPEWANLYDESMAVKHNWKEYSKQYFNYIENNTDELVDKILENMPEYKAHKSQMVNECKTAMENINKNFSLNSNELMVLRNVLAVTINRVGVV